MFKLLNCLLIFMMLNGSSCFEVKAYVLNKQSVGYNCKYRVDSSANSYKSNLAYTEKWNYSGAKVFLKESNTGVISIVHAYSGISNGTYAVCTYESSNRSTIRYYYAFKKATTAQRNETVVHEVGHAIGLSHTQSKNDKNSVMRATEFNGKAYPLSDDKAGMNKKY